MLKQEKGRVFRKEREGAVHGKHLCLMPWPRSSIGEHHRRDAEYVLLIDLVYVADKQTECRDRLGKM